MENNKNHPCEYCRLPTSQEFFIHAPNIDSPQRELRYWLCPICAKDLQNAGVQIRKIMEE
jgi:hypothetical protein